MSVEKSHCGYHQKLKTVRTTNLVIRPRKGFPSGICPGITNRQLAAEIAAGFERVRAKREYKCQRLEEAAAISQETEQAMRKLGLA